ncbi:molybdate ABC transporter, inner membrane subunit [Psychromonas ingrahamii 37]|uniref:Molybdenum transport system permease n=1 Tax=Psychromonas ingrahamii (strain DSM 17664 / CCUG 51855 / 37) TaxID=357804 RepID=A1SWP1_PSYIN|nr:molybdate ABC transporter permease subunit [Psychromonas ingrahamii]ABM03906.1 molybdate ABC transporter, inner membrane subunit [Psychromonas ingrahamii 37]
MLTELDYSAIILTFKLAGLTTLILLIISPPLAWWLARSRFVLRPFIEALVALPLVLPPTVLGFYLLISFSPDNFIGGLWLRLTGDTLAFSFIGLLIASVIYSLPFVVQPLQSAFVNLDKDYLEVAATLGFNSTETFYKVVFPMVLPSFIIAGALGFAHTVGEFGVVLMIGGNIPGETQLLSIALFDHVETLQYQQAHLLSFGLLAFSMTLLVLIYGVLKKRQQRMIDA